MPSQEEVEKAMQEATAQQIAGEAKYNALSFGLIGGKAQLVPTSKIEQLKQRRLQTQQFLEKIDRLIVLIEASPEVAEAISLNDYI